MNYYDILLAKKLNGGGGGSATLIDKNISANGTYNASTDSADGYKKVVVSVPNPSTGSLSITSNNTYDVTNYASAVVNVPQGVTPTGTIPITSNGTVDVTNYASAEVNVGGSSPFVLLDTITVSEDVRAVNVDFSSYIANYDVILLYENLTLSSADFLYYVINGSSPSGGTYSNGSISNHKGISAWKMKVPGGYFSTNYAYVNSSQGGFASGSTVMNNLYIYTYGSAKRIKANSYFKIYGGNYADL